MKILKKLQIFVCHFLFLSNILSAAYQDPPKTVWEAIMKEQSKLNLSRGVNYMSEEEYSKASIEFLKAIEKDPSSMAYTMYAASLYWMGDNEGALKNYEKALDLDPKNDIAWQLKGISMAKDGKIKEALECFKKSESINPLRSDVLMNIGSVYFSLGNITEAVKYLKKAIKSDDRNPLYYYQLGLIYFSTEDFANAIKNFETARSLKPDYEEAILWLGISYEKTGERKKALSAYKKAISIKPYDYFARYKLAGITKDLKEIIPCFELTPQKDNSSIPLQISYSQNNFKKTAHGANPITKALYDNLMAVKEDEMAHLSVDIIEMENITLEKKKEGELEKKLSQKFKPVSHRIITKNYTIEGTNSKANEIEKIIKDIEKTLSEKSNYRVNFDIKTTKTNKKTAQSLTYIPRNIGNDMGLWIIGNPWIALIEEDLEDFEEEKKPTETAIKALGMLLVGEIDKSEKEFFRIQKEIPEISELAIGVIDYLNGKKEEAEKRFENALKINPKNKTAQKNIRWINGNK